jgi:hypothetical protein
VGQACRINNARGLSAAPPIASGLLEGHLFYGCAAQQALLGRG